MLKGPKYMQNVIEDKGILLTFLAWAVRVTCFEMDMSTILKAVHISNLKTIISFNINSLLIFDS
jgi:hypothetical protein